MRPSDQSRKSEYAELEEFPEKNQKGYEDALALNPAQNPQNVADAILELVDIPAGKRPVRTVVDNMGMGPHIKTYNEQFEQLMSVIYTNFGMVNMLKLKTNLETD
jgi:hypothetical protein